MVSGLVVGDPLRTISNQKGVDAVSSSHTKPTSRNLRWGLIGGATGLLVAFGLTTGGVILWLFVAIAIALNLVGWFEMDRIEQAIARRGGRRRPQTRAASTRRSP